MASMLAWPSQEQTPQPVQTPIPFLYLLHRHSQLSLLTVTHLPDLTAAYPAVPNPTPLTFPLNTAFAFSSQRVFGKVYLGDEPRNQALAANRGWLFRDPTRSPQAGRGLAVPRMRLEPESRGPHTSLGCPRRPTPLPSQTTKQLSTSQKPAPRI